MAALVAGQRGRRVLLIDHADEPGKKILISGGGRCNFTNLHTAPDRFISANPHFMKSALARYTERDFLALVERHGIAWHEKTLGQLFCDGSARQIVAMMWEECAAAGVELWLGHPGSASSAMHRLSHQAAAHATQPRRASCSPPAVRRSRRWARPALPMTWQRFGLKIVEPRPALVPLTLRRGRPAVSLALGVAGAGRRQRRARPAVPRGRARSPTAALSGPAILQVSSYWRLGEQMMDRFPARRARQLARRGQARRSAPVRSAGWSSSVLPRASPRRCATGSGSMVRSAASAIAR